MRTFLHDYPFCLRLVYWTCAAINIVMLQGCFTPREPGDYLYFHRIEGFSYRDVPKNPDYIVVSYRSSRNIPFRGCLVYYYAIEVKNHEMSSEFMYTGSKLYFGEIAEELQKGAINKISAHRFSKEQERLAGKLMRASHYQFANSVPPSIIAPAIDGNCTGPAWGVILVPFLWYDEPFVTRGPLGESELFKPGMARRFNFNNPQEPRDPRFKVMILPHDQPIKTTDHVKNEIAVLPFLPIELATVILMTPLWILTSALWSLN